MENQQVKVVKADAAMASMAPLPAKLEDCCRKDSEEELHLLQGSEQQPNLSKISTKCSSYSARDDGDSQFRDHSDRSSTEQDKQQPPAEPVPNIEINMTKSDSEGSTEGNETCIAASLQALH